MIFDPFTLCSAARLEQMNLLTAAAEHSDLSASLKAIETLVSIECVKNRAKKFVS